MTFPGREISIYAQRRGVKRKGGTPLQGRALPGRSLHAVAESCGVSYRQAFYWCVTEGLLEANVYSPGGRMLGLAPQGQGNRVRLSYEQEVALWHTAQLVRAGMLASLAAPLGRQLAAGRDSVPLGPGLLLVVALEHGGDGGYSQQGGHEERTT